MKRFLLIFVAIVIGIQFVRPEKNISDEAPTPEHLAVIHPPSDEVKAILQRACYDCHTNNTRYPWYAHVQPVAWWLNSHIEEGKEHFNFDTFGSYSKKRQLHKLEELVEMITEKEMPLRSYTLVHTDAKLTNEEIEALASWTEGALTKIMKR